MEKGGLGAALSAAGVTAADALAHADEMRLGLRGQVRRVWAPRGVKVRQPLQLTSQWSYLALAVDGGTGRLWWTWQPNMKADAVRQTVQAWQATGLDALVWDGAPGHRARVVREVGMKLIHLPPAAPELNPAERLFEELRRAVEGRVYATLADKQAAVEQELAELAADPARVCQLAGWAWIRAALPPPDYAALS